MDDAPHGDAERQLRQNLVELMQWRKLTQADLADALGKTQSWVSKRLSGTSRFQFEDLDGLSRVFGLSPAELLQPGYGKWDRRSGQQRRVLPDRRGRPRPGVKPRLRYKPDTPPLPDTDDDDDAPTPPRRPEDGGPLAL